MRIIHCADLHLDSVLNTNMGAEQSRRRRNELLSNFDRLLDYAQENNVNVIIIAGDMFDMTTTSTKVVNYICDRIASKPNIDFFYCVGNHEGENALANVDLPNLIVFEDTFTTYKYSNVAITGKSNAPYQYAISRLDLNPQDINIVVAHAQLQKYATSSDDCISYDVLRNKNIDYLALGHEHSFSHGAIDSRGQWCYSGCLEGRGFDESGKKGFVLLDINNGINSTFVPFANRTLHQISVDIGNLVKFTDIEHAVESSLHSIDNKDMVEVLLVGEVDENCQIDTIHLSQLLNDRFFFGRVKDKTTISQNITRLTSEISLKGMFVKNVLDSQLTQAQKEQVIKLGLSALSGNKEAL